MKKIFLVVLLLCSTLFISTATFAQCDNYAPINDSTVSVITSPYQISYLSQNTVTKLDSLVFSLMNHDKYVGPKYYKDIVDQIGALRSPNAYAFLFTCCCRPIIVSDVNAFNTLTSIVSYYNGYEALNKYYLNGKIKKEGDDFAYWTEIIIECYKNEPLSFYCVKELPIADAQNTVINGRYHKHDTIINGNEYHWKYLYPLSRYAYAFGEDYSNGKRNGAWLSVNRNNEKWHLSLYHYDNDTIMGEAIEWYHHNYPTIVEFKGLMIYGDKVGEWEYYEFEASKEKQKVKTASLVYDDNQNILVRNFYHKNGKPSASYYFDENGTAVWYTHYNEKGKIIEESKGRAPDVLQ